MFRKTMFTLAAVAWLLSAYHGYPVKIEDVMKWRIAPKSIDSPSATIVGSEDSKTD